MYDKQDYERENGVTCSKTRRCYVCGKSHRLDCKWRGFLFTADGTGRIYCDSQPCVEAHKAHRKREAEEHRKELRAEWYQKHKEEVLAKQRERRKYNPGKDKVWNAAHREQINQHIRERKEADPVYKLKCQARNTIYQSFARTGNVKQARCENITGLSIDDLILHLCDTYERTYGAKWDGTAAVHIDHIVPLVTAKSEDDVIRLCHYTNLQLLKAKDNLMKGSKYA